MSEVAIIVPMLHRAHRVEPLLASITAATPEPHRVLFAVTPGDDQVIEAVDRAGADVITVTRRPSGDYARKINAGVRATSEPLVFTGADDLHFHPGWLAVAVAALRPGIGVVGTNDLCNKRVLRGEHATHLLVTRTYIERYGTIDEPGKVFHEGYPHEFVDDEAVATAKQRRAWVFAADSIVEHLHPTVGKAPMDELYAQQAARMTVGRRIYRRRCRLWT